MLFQKHKKAFLAWSLLSLLCTQQVAGRVYMSVEYAVEIESAMNATEVSIAGLIQEDTGIETTVRIHDEAQVNHLFSLGYGAPFIATEVLDGDTAYFSVQHDPVQTTNYTHILKTPIHPDSKSGQQVSLEKWFPDFCFDHKAITVNDFIVPCMIRFPFEATITVSHHSMPSPPPEFA